MKEFMANPESRDEMYVKGSNGLFPAIEGVSYMDRFDILCRRLMQKKSLYRSFCNSISKGSY